MIQLTSPASLLHDDPVGMVKANGAARLEVIDAKLRSRFALLGRAQAGEALHVLRLIEELCKPAFEVVVGRHVVEHGPLGHQWSASSAAK